MCRINGGYVSSVIYDKLGIPTIILNSSGYINNVFSDINYMGNNWVQGLNITISNSIVNNINNMLLMNGNQFDPMDPLQGHMNAVIDSGGIVSNYKNWVGSTIISNGGIIYNASCYYAQSITVLSNGSIGTIHLHNPEYDGSVSISSVGGSPTLTLSNGGRIDTVNIGYGGIVCRGYISTFNQSNGYIIIRSNGSIGTATVSPREFYLSNGGIIDNLTQTGGPVVIRSNGLVSNYTMSNGALNVSSGATINSLTISSGTVNISSGLINNLNMKSSDTIIMSGGSISTCTMSTGKLSTFVGASINSLMISSNTKGRGSCTLSNTSITELTLNVGGGTINNTIVDYLYAHRGYAILQNSNTIISSADINCSDFILRNSAKVISATFGDNRQGSGNIAISNGGVISNLTWSSVDPMLNAPDRNINNI